MILREFSLWFRVLRTRLVSVRLRVGSLASISGLRIRHWHKLWCRSQPCLGSGIAVAVVEAGSCSSDSDPLLGPSM